MSCSRSDSDGALRGCEADGVTQIRYMESSPRKTLALLHSRTSEPDGFRSHMMGWWQEKG